jgi:hypothetical protein
MFRTEGVDQQLVVQMVGADQQLIFPMVLIDQQLTFQIGKAYRQGDLLVI